MFLVEAKVQKSAFSNESTLGLFHKSVDLNISLRANEYFEILKSTENLNSMGCGLS